MIRALDLCCGAGGWAVAARGLPIRIEVAVDWWDAACMTYKLNHPDTHVIQADLRAAPLNAEAMRGRFDLVLGGIPCEWLSRSRLRNKRNWVKQDEIERERELLDWVLGFIGAIAPRWWSLEDVKGLVGELPPLTPWQEINSRNYSAQRRKRVYVGEFPPPKPTPAGEHAMIEDHLRPGPHRIGRRTFGRTPVKHNAWGKNTIYAVERGHKAPTVCAYGSRHESELALADPRLPGGGLRQVEWQECARLQGYPEDYLFYGSATDVSQMIGRSVQIDTGRAILEAIVAEAVGKGNA